MDQREIEWIPSPPPKPISPTGLNLELLDCRDPAACLSMLSVNQMLPEAGSGDMGDASKHRLMVNVPAPHLHWILFPLHWHGVPTRSCPDLQPLQRLDIQLEKKQK